MTQYSASSSAPRAMTGSDKLLFLAKIAVSAILLGLCFYLVDFRQPFVILATINPLYLALAFVCTATGTILLPAMITYQALAVSKTVMNLRELVTLNLAIRFYGTILPRVFSIWLRWRRYGKGKLSETALALLAFERIVQLATLSFFAFVALGFERSVLGAEGTVLWLFTAVASLGSIAILAPFLSAKMADILQKSAPHVSRILPRFLSSRLLKLVDAVTAFQDMNGKMVTRISVYSVTAFFLFVASAYVCAVALQIPISFLALMWIRPLVFMLTLIPISVAGIGLREVGFAGLLALYGFDLPTAIAFSFANFGLQLVLAAIGGLLEAYGFFQGDKAVHPTPA